MRITSAVLHSASVLYLAFMTSAALAASDTVQSHSEYSTASVTRGKYLVDTAGCHDCHTPWVMGPDGPAPDMSRALSGHPQSLQMPPAPKLPEGPWLVSGAATNTAWAGPWGVSFTANLTPDKETGLGKWTERNFIETIRTGRHLGRGRPVLPPMPIQVYRNMTDGDLAAIFAYLQSIPAVNNRVPTPITAEE
ncbi:c-type cytochrome [Pseudomonas sp. MBLB4136]|uniref:c-type cytochrome n=1 Tax=Pseudomonas sp. MBLB4136 TaxID=3451558 RepID=UPI003F756D81